MNGQLRTWDHDECPRDGCDGELSQQDRLNVICRACEEVWTHVRTETEHKLQTAEFEIVAEKPIAKTDGGQCTGDSNTQADNSIDRRDPTEDPYACSLCGVHIEFRGEYCDPCAREVGAKPPMRRCMGCGRDYPQEWMDSVDISPDDEYYPEIRYLCGDCSGGESDD